MCTGMLDARFNMAYCDQKRRKKNIFKLILKVRYGTEKEALIRGQTVDDKSSRKVEVVSCP